MDGDLRAYLKKMCAQKCGKLCPAAKQCQARIKDMLRLCAKDKNGAYLVSEALDAARSYVTAVYNMERVYRLHVSLPGDLDARERCEMADHRRRMAHDAMCASIVAANRYLFAHFPGQVPVGGICAGVSESRMLADRRYAFAEWARIFVCSEFHLQEEKTPL